MRAVAVARAESDPVSPVYQITVSAELPVVIAVALPKPGPVTRGGGVLASALKNSFDACTAEAAVNAVAANVPSEVVIALLRLAAVAVPSAPIRN